MFQTLGDFVAFRLLGLARESGAAEAVQFFVMDLAKIFGLLLSVI